MSLQALAGEIAAALAPLQSTIPDLQVHQGWVENPTPPQIDIYPPPGLFLAAAGFGPAAKQVFWTVRLRVNMADSEAAQNLLLNMLDPTNPASVTVALERVAAEPAEVTGFHQYADDNGEQRMLGCEWTVSQFLQDGATVFEPPPPAESASTATVTQLQPDSVAAGGMVSVIVNGTGFQPDATVEAVGVGPQPVLEHISAAQIQTNYTFPSNPGVYQVGVRNPGEGLSNTLPFTVT